MAATGSEASKWAGERTITEFWASVGATNKSNQLAASLPFGLGLLVYVPAYVARVLNPMTAIRYTLTNQRLRLDKGVRKETVKSVPLADIDEVRVVDEIPFTRTGVVEVLSKGQVVMRLEGIQDPQPARQTIVDAVASRIEVQKVLDNQSKSASAAGSAGSAGTA